MHSSLTVRNFLAQTYICVAVLATWDVSPDVKMRNLYTHYSAHMSPENTHKLMGFYMEGLILGVNTMYMLFCFFKLFPLGCIGLKPLHGLCGFCTCNNFPLTVRCTFVCSQATPPAPGHHTQLPLLCCPRRWTRLLPSLGTTPKGWSRSMCHGRKWEVLRTDSHSSQRKKYLQRYTMKLLLPYLQGVVPIQIEWRETMVLGSHISRGLLPLFQ